MDARRAALSRLGPAGVRVLLPALAIAVAMAAVLLALGNAYGFHRDELYFIVAGRHPAFGYVDQPPLTPLLSAAIVAVLGPTPLAIRVLPALAAAVVVVLAAVMAGNLGAGRRGRTLAALVTAISGVLAAGHLDHTTTFDILAWTVVLALVVRLLRGGDQRLWWAVGITAGIGLENKHLVLLLGLGLGAGLVLGGRRDLLRRRGPWLAVVVALAIWAPNLAWQMSHGLPQVAMAQSIAEDGVVNRVKLVPFQLLQAGPFLWPIAVAGLWWLCRAPAARPWRPIGYGYLVILVVLLASGGKYYYALGFLPALLAAGAVPLDGWLRTVTRRRALAGAVVASGALMAVGTLPLLPPAILARTPLPALYAESADQVGWPELVDAVERAVSTLPPGERERASILTGNYGQAAALAVLGSPDLPPVVSGHNAFGAWGPPPDDRDVVILVGSWWPGRAAFAEDCRLLGTVDNGVGLANAEQGDGIWACRLNQPWSVAWPSIWFVR